MMYDDICFLKPITNKILQYICVKHVNASFHDKINLISMF